MGELLKERRWNMDLRDLEAEKSILGGVLLEPECLAEVARIVRPDDFHERRHALLFQAFLAMSDRGIPCDLVTAAGHLRDQGLIEEATYLNTLADFIPTSANIAFYARRVKELSLRRALVEAARNAATAAREAPNFAEALDMAEAGLLSLRSDQPGQSGPRAVSETLGAAFRQLERIYEARGGVAGVPTGFRDLDRMTCGLQAGDLVIIAGRPSMGKTALALNVLETAARAGVRCLMFSLEMSREQLINRLISSHSRVDSHRFRSGEFRNDDWAKMYEATGRLKSLPILIDDAASPTVFDLRSKARRIARDGGLGLVVIDYLQLMKPAKSHPTREREVAELSRSLKALAKELNVPVVVLAQLNRQVEAGANPRRPVPSDLRESGSLEQDADLIVFPWRESAYCSDCRQQGGDCGKGHYFKAEFIIGKQRNGPVGTVKAAWLPNLTRFEDLAAT